MTDLSITLWQDLPRLSRFHIVMRTAAGAPVTGLVGSFTVYRAKTNPLGATLITPTMEEVDAVNMPGIYRVTLTAASLDTAGKLTMRFTGGAAEPTVVFATVEPRPEAAL